MKAIWLLSAWPAPTTAFLTRLGEYSATRRPHLAGAVAREDKAAVARANGVGPKLALRIVTELKGKPLGDVTFAPTAPGVHVEIAAPAPSLAGEAVSALLGLGVAEVNARRAVDQALIRLGDEAELPAVIRAALQELGR